MLPPCFPRSRPAPASGGRPRCLAILPYPRRAHELLRAPRTGRKDPGREADRGTRRRVRRRHPGPPPILVFMASTVNTRPGRERTPREPQEHEIPLEQGAVRVLGRGHRPGDACDGHPSAGFGASGRTGVRAMQQHPQSPERKYGPEPLEQAAGEINQENRTASLTGMRHRILAIRDRRRQQASPVYLFNGLCAGLSRGC